MFVDDILLFGKASVRQMDKVKDVLHKFCLYSSQAVSFEKSNILFSKNVPAQLRREIIGDSGFTETFSFRKYLGVPLTGKVPRYQDFHYLIDKVKAKLSGWKAKQLSFVGRVMLSKAVIQAIPVYPMMTTLIPRGCLDEIQRLQRDFIWGDTHEQWKIHLISWKTVMLPKKNGGLAVRDLALMNKACIMKLGWQLRNDEQSLWCSVLRGKYDRVRDVSDYPILQPSDSPIWKAIVDIWEHIQQFQAWAVGDGTRIDFWDDRWFDPYTFLRDMVDAIPLHLNSVKVNEHGE